MENINITQENKTLKIQTNKDLRVMVIEGNSYSLDIVKDFNIVYQWIEHYFIQNDALQIIFILHVFNASTLKCLLDLLCQLEYYHDTGKLVHLLWYYRDKAVKEIGKIIFEDSHLKHNIKKLSRYTKRLGGI